MITTKTYKQFHVEYLTSNNNKHISMGTFMALKPFYIRSATTNDIKMCCCKKHLHAHWAINALTDCAKAQSLDLDTIESYDTFFEYLTSSSAKETTYLAWECTPNKREFCKDITTKWENLRASLIERSNDEVTVQLMHFAKLEVTTKAGKKLKRLKARSIPVNITFIVGFISSFFTKIINHRNQLKHYRTCIKSFREHFA